MSIGAGDIVILKSGGPLMTVTMLDQNGYIVTRWFNRNDDMKEGTFLPSELTKVG